MRRINSRPLPFNDPEVRAAIMAAGFAAELGIEPGNMWEAPMARSLYVNYLHIGDWDEVEWRWRLRLGLTTHAHP